MKFGIGNEVETYFASNASAMIPTATGAEREVPRKPSIQPELRDTEQIEQTPPKKKYDKAWLVSLWHNFDIKFMKPLLTNSTPNLMETLHPCCMPLSRLLTTEEQMSNPCVHIEADSDTDMIIDHRELSIGESISTVSHGATQDTDKHDITEVKADLNGLSQGAFPSHNSMSSDDVPLTP
ncbi:solute carrier family 9 (sodium/hydrogen exchanger), member 6/7 [Mytilus galloprovincialis]|uniref:Solute carrier family 9 (Sodium/hydrogen exchanger), member 6/7 n=1 Tax=Mytilus galloprovincialis TaxID=29158 RepID=A0A8B6CDI9_MYTGA|nr:solute carrier family 9 (sodium/hydrogen exchanger), member 6/7 [Mytilus galloprovincialis]